MENSSESGRVTCQLCLEGEMTIFTASDVKQRLLSPLTDCQQIDVDLSQVSEMDSAGLQLMVLVKREATAQHKSLRFVAPSQAVLDVLELYQLAGYFGDPPVIAAAANH